MRAVRRWWRRILPTWPYVFEVAYRRHDDHQVSGGVFAMNVPMWRNPNTALVAAVHNHDGLGWALNAHRDTGDGPAACIRMLTEVMALNPRVPMAEASVGDYWVTVRSTPTGPADPEDTL